MPTYIAKRSFYGDLGSVRRRQVLKIGDSRLAEQLLSKKLIEKHVEAASADDPETGSSQQSPKPTAKAKAKA